MKKLYLLLFILTATIAKSQNWQTVYSDRVQYFDSSRQGIKIVSKATYTDSLGNIDSVFWNYPQHLIHSFLKVIDSSSWLGRRMVIRSDGYNGFMNDSGEFLWLNTLANLNETFTFIDNQKVNITGICDRVFYADTLGIKDSIKHFSFTFKTKPGYKGKFENDTQKFEVLLSQHNGLLKTPAFSGVIFKKDNAALGRVPLTYFYKNYFTYYYFNNKDVGDEFEYKTKDDSHVTLYEYTTYNTVTGKKLLPFDSVEYTYYYKTFNQVKYSGTGAPPVSTKTSVGESKGKMPLNKNNIEGWMPNQLVYNSKYISTTEYFFWDSCHMTIKSKFIGTIDNNGYFRGPFEQEGGTDYYSKRGTFKWSKDGSVIAGKQVGWGYNFIYSNYCNSVSGKPGIKYTVFPESVDELNNGKISVYPNPASTTVTIKAAKNATIRLSDVQGREVAATIIARENDKIILDISHLTDGLYFVEIPGQTTTKILIRH